MCDSVRVRVAYDAPTDAPTAFVAKLPAADETSRATAVAMRSYEKEVRFYEQLATDLPIPTPIVFHGALDADDLSRFVLLLEDLAPSAVADQVAGLTFDEAAMAVDALARLHARWWGDPALDRLDWLLAINSPEFKRLTDIYPQCWPAVLDFVGEAMPAEVRDAGARLATQMARMLDQAYERPRTMAHGDYRADNMFFRPGCEIVPFAVADWQIVFKGNAVFDLAYLLTGSLDVDVRRSRERELLALYHGRLVAKGVRGYSLDDCLDDYRFWVMLGLAWPVVAIGTLDTANDRGVLLFRTWIERAMAAIVDWDAQEMLPKR
jgi:aminoglycoside/choline kinase family phosphotransferase